MKSPTDIDPLTPADRAQAKELTEQIEKWFEDGHEEYHVNWAVPEAGTDHIPEKVWREAVQIASRAGWNATMQGAIVIVKKR